MPKLTKTVVEAATPGEKQYTVWCSELKGFGVFILPSGQRTYFVDYRNAEDVRRRMTIGRHGKITAEEARKIAVATLGSVVKGEDPAGERVTRRKSITIAELCEKYLKACEKGLILGKGNRPKKASTIYTDRSRIYGHIIPLLGVRRVIDLKPVDIKKFLKDVASGATAKVQKTKKLRGKSIVRGGNGTAARTTGLLGGILTYAFDEGIIEKNPAEGVRKPASVKRKRRISVEEYRQLGAALAAALAEGETHQLIDGVWLLALTGCRLGEIISLKHTEVDASGGALRFEDSKEGASVRPIGRAALNHIATIRKQDGYSTVLVPARKAAIFGGMPRGWKRVAQRAGFTNITLHTLRHGFASVAGDLGYSEPTIAAMLGHAMGSVTGRYIHQLDAVLVAAADKVAAKILAMMTEEAVAQPETSESAQGFAGSLAAAA